MAALRNITVRSFYLQQIFLNHRCFGKIFKYFSYNAGGEENCQLLKALDEFKDVKLAPLSVRACSFERSFSNAQLDVFPYLEDRCGNAIDPEDTWITNKELENAQVRTSYVDFSSLFRQGFDSIKRLEQDDGNLESQVMFAAEAFKSGFLKNIDFHVDCLEELRDPVFKHEFDVSKFTALLASHILSQLVINNNGFPCIISNDLNGKYNVCPCSNKECSQEIKYDGHGIGSEYLWYGKPDITVITAGGGFCNIVVARADNNYRLIEEYEQEDTDRQSVEVVDLRNDFIVQQAVSQTITFSIYQKFHQMRNPQRFLSVTTLTPTIVVYRDVFDVYFYDSDNDILLRNADEPLPLWDVSPFNIRKNFNMSSILVLWMAVNHLSFQPSLRQFEIRKLKGTCGFANEIKNNRLLKVKETIGMQNQFPPLRKIMKQLSTRVPLFTITP